MLSRAPALCLLLFAALSPATLASSDVSKSLRAAADRIASALLKPREARAIAQFQTTTPANAAMHGQLYSDRNCSQAGFSVREHGVEITFDEVYVRPEIYAAQIGGACKEDNECHRETLNDGTEFFARVISCTSSFGDVPARSGSISALPCQENTPLRTLPTLPM